MKDEEGKPHDNSKVRCIVVRTLDTSPLNVAYKRRRPTLIMLKGRNRHH